MTCILYRLVDGEIEVSRHQGDQVAALLDEGYSAALKGIKTKKADTNNSGKLSSEEVKAAAKEAGITIGRKSVKTLMKELGI